MQTLVTMNTADAPSFTKVVELRNFVLPIRRFDPRETAGFLRCDIIAVVPDNETGELRDLHWARFMPRAMTDEQVVDDIYRELRNMVIHELAEAWHVDGSRVDDPHGDLQPVCAVCRKLATCEWREYDNPTVWTCAVCYPPFPALRETA